MTTFPRFAGLVALLGLAMLSSPASAAAASDGASRGGATAVARATATIAQATELRAEELYAAAGQYAEASGLAVEPIGVSHRDCADSREESSCGLVILDMP